MSPGVDLVPWRDSLIWLIEKRLGQSSDAVRLVEVVMMGPRQSICDALLRFLATFT